MAQLHDVVGAILRDIAQSRVTSDLYSREVSRYYEEDSLLRLFPIPRTEIKEVEVDLNFGIAEVTKDVSREQDKQVYIGRIIERYSDKITDQIFEKLRGSQRTKIGKDIKWQELISHIDSVNLRADFKFKITNFFEDNSSGLIIESDKGTSEGSNVSLDLKVNLANEGILKIVENTVLVIKEVQQLVKERGLKDSLENSLDNGLIDVLDAMDKDLSFEVEAYAVDITVAASDLAELPENTISKIKVVAEVKNYNWSQVEEKDNKVVRRLIPE